MIVKDDSTRYKWTFFLNVSFQAVDAFDHFLGEVGVKGGRRAQR